jgi:hypothetical protein
MSGKEEGDYMRAVDRLLNFMGQHQMNAIDFATYDRARRLYEQDPVRQSEWLNVLAESKTDHRVKVRRITMGTVVEAVRAYA